MQEWAWLKEASAYGVILFIVVVLGRFFLKQFETLVDAYKEATKGFKDTMDNHLDKQQESFERLINKLESMK